MHRIGLIIVLCLTACSTDPKTAGTRALSEGHHLEAVKQLRQAAERSDDEETTKLYQKALSQTEAELRRARTSVETCENAVKTLSAIEGFGREKAAEAEVLSHAYVCSARHQARKGRYAEAAEIVVKGVKRLPGFNPDSPVLLKSLREPALKAARSGRVNEATALAQVFYGSGEGGFAISLLDLLEAAGPGPEDVYPVLRDRASKAKTSDAAAGLAAAYGLWHGHADQASTWFSDLAAQKREPGARAGALARQFKIRGEEAYWIAQAGGASCEIVQGAKNVASKVPSIPAIALTPVKGGFLLAWMEGSSPPPPPGTPPAKARSKAKAPEQNLKIVRVGLNGSPAEPTVVAKNLLAAEKAAENDVQAAFAPKNFETSLALIECGGRIELAARGAPRGEWVRATVSETGQVSSPPASIPPLSETARMPSEDVWWNVGCANDQLVHLWLADTHLMRLAWFDDGEVEGEVANMRIPGFSPHFVAAGLEDEATLVVWIDITGEGASQIVRVAIPEDHSVPTAEESTAVSLEPVIESIGGRTEHLRLTPIGGRYALTWVPQGGDLSLRPLSLTGAPQGEIATVVQLRGDARDVRFDAASAGDRVGLAWTESLTDRWAALHFLSVDGSGGRATAPQRLTGLVRPDVSPQVAGSSGVFAVAWVDRTAAEGEALRLSVLRCGGGEE